MAKNIKINREELERDEVAEGVHELVGSLQRNRNKLIGALLAIILLVIVVTAVRGHQDKVRRETNSLLSQIMDQYGQIQRQEEPKQRGETVEAAKRMINTLRDSYPGSPAALEALYLKGKFFYTIDKFEDAQTAYQEYINEAKNNEQRARGEIALGYALENQSFFLKDNKGRADKLTAANTHYKLAGNLATPASYLYYYSLMNQARILELLDQKPEALKLYEQVLKDRPAVKTEAKEEKPLDPNDYMGALTRQLQEQGQLLSFASTAETHRARLQSQIETQQKVETVKGK